MECNSESLNICPVLKEGEKQSVVSVRFKTEELDEKAAKLH